MKHFSIIIIFLLSTQCYAINPNVDWVVYKSLFEYEKSLPANDKMSFAGSIIERAFAAKSLNYSNGYIADRFLEIRQLMTDDEPERNKLIYQRCLANTLAGRLDLADSLYNIANHNSNLPSDLYIKIIFKKLSLKDAIAQANTLEKRTWVLLAMLNNFPQTKIPQALISLSNIDKKFPSYPLSSNRLWYSLLLAENDRPEDALYELDLFLREFIHTSPLEQYNSLPLPFFAIAERVWLHYAHHYLKEIFPHLSNDFKNIDLACQAYILFQMNEWIDAVKIADKISQKGEVTPLTQFPIQLKWTIDQCKSPANLKFNFKNNLNHLMCQTLYGIGCFEWRNNSKDNGFDLLNSASEKLLAFIAGYYKISSEYIGYKDVTKFVSDYSYSFIYPNPFQQLLYYNSLALLFSGKVSQAEKILNLTLEKNSMNPMLDNDAYIIINRMIFRFNAKDYAVCMNIINLNKETYPEFNLLAMFIKYVVANE